MCVQGGHQYFASVENGEIVAMQTFIAICLSRNRQGISNRGVLNQDMPMVDESKLKNNIIYNDNLDNPVKPTKSSSGIEIETHEFSSFSAIFSSNCLEFLLRRKNGFQMEIFDKPFAIRYTQFLSSRDLS